MIPYPSPILTPRLPTTAPYIFPGYESLNIKMYFFIGQYWRMSPTPSISPKDNMEKTLIFTNQYHYVEKLTPGFAKITTLFFQLIILNYFNSTWILWIYLNSMYSFLFIRIAWNALKLIQIISNSLSSSKSSEFPEFPDIPGFL